MHTCIYGLQGFLINFYFYNTKRTQYITKSFLLVLQSLQKWRMQNRWAVAEAILTLRQQTIIFKREKHILRHVKFKGKLFSYRQIMIQSSVRLYTSKAFNNIFNLVNTGIFCNILKSKRLVYQKNKILMQFFILSKYTILFFL